MHIFEIYTSLYNKIKFIWENNIVKPVHIVYVVKYNILPTVHI